MVDLVFDVVTVGEPNTGRGICAAVFLDVVVLRAVKISATPMAELTWDWAAGKDVEDFGTDVVTELDLAAARNGGCDCNEDTFVLEADVVAVLATA